MAIKTKIRPRKIASKKINLPMLLPVAPAVDTSSLFTEQGIKEKVATWVQSRMVQLDPDTVADGIINILNAYSYVLTKASSAVPKVVDGFKLDSIEIGISIDAEGSVGIVSLGGEASLKFSWKL